LHHFELGELLPLDARIRCGQLDEHAASLDCTPQFRYRLPTSALAYWFASPANRSGDSVWSIAIRELACLVAVVTSN
jgi:hypothetical protein